MTWSKFLLSIEGRINRQAFWLRFYVPVMVISIALTILDLAVGTYSLESGGGLFSGIFTLLVIWPSIAVGVKRLHDRNRSGWWLLLILVPIIGAIWYLVDAGILKGTEGSNRFGPDPLVRDARL